MQHPVYMKVTKDRFELPIVVADSAYELARLCGVDVSTIKYSISRQSKHIIKNSQYKRVWVSDLEDE